MVQLVNGYTCYNPADAALAKRGIDPAAAPSRPGGATAMRSTAAGDAGWPTGATASGPAEAHRPGGPAGGRGQFVDLLA